MKFLPLVVGWSVLGLMPVAVNAAGTYYTGNYQSPQVGYAQRTYAQRGQNANYSSQGVSAYNRNQYANAGYSTAATNTRTMPQRSQSRAASAPAGGNVVNDGGFTLGAGFSRQMAAWKFEMKESGSILRYDDVNWNVFDLDANYDFMAGQTPVRLTAGLQYGMQAGDANMIDDDITNGGYFVVQWVDTDGNKLGDQIGHALSVGASTGGNMLGMNVGIGLTDFMRWGNLKVTPTVGWRYLKYKLETENNKGVSIDTFTGSGGCFTVEGTDEVDCDPVLIFYDGNGNALLAVRGDTNGDDKLDLNDEIAIPTPGSGMGSVEYVSPGDTFYYEQGGVSHSYEVEWSGPYFALDMLYDINATNSVNGYVELGLPSYTAIGDQPYRFDWAHPKSVEDKAGIGSAFHLGMGATWSTAITDSVALSIGLTYDYYTVSDADAKTYLNGALYSDYYNTILDYWEQSGKTEADMLNPETGDANAIAIKQLETECPGWVCSAAGEIESFYKSMGIRVGLNAKF